MLYPLFFEFFPLLKLSGSPARRPPNLFKKNWWAEGGSKSKNIKKNLRVLSMKSVIFMFLKVNEKMEIFSSKLVPKPVTLRKKIHRNMEIKVLLVRTIRMTLPL